MQEEREAGSQQGGKTIINGDRTRTHLQHGLDTPVADLLPGSPDPFATLFEPEASLDELLAVLDEQVPDGLVADGCDLDELGEAVPDLEVS